MSVDAGQRICSRCGQLKPLADFDRRFVSKPCKVTCAACRGFEDESQKWYTVNARIALQEEQQRLRPMRKAAWRERIRALGFNEREQQAILHVHFSIDNSKTSWPEIKRRFYDLEPPYCRSNQVRRYISPSEKHRIFTAQRGHCYYCDNPIIVSGEPELIACLCYDCYRDRGSIGYTSRRPARAHCLRGQIEHKTPRSRGGSDEYENLCYACIACNLRKWTRTAQEFAQYPEDPISRFPCDPVAVLSALEYELRGYDGFRFKLPWE